MRKNHHENFCGVQSGNHKHSKFFEMLENQLNPQHYLSSLSDDQSECLMTKIEQIHPKDLTGEILDTYIEHCW